MNILYPLSNLFSGIARKSGNERARPSSIFEYLWLKVVFFMGASLLLAGFTQSDHAPSPSFFFFNGINAGPDVAVCAGDSVQLVVTGGTNYTWSPATGLSCTDCPTPKAAPDTTTLYIVQSEDSTGNICSDSVLVTVSQPPQVDSVSTTNLSGCDALDGSIVIHASGGTGSWEFSIDNGFSWQSDSLFSGLPSGIYQVVIRNNNGSCEVSGGEITLSAPAAPTITDIITNNPTQCDLPNGTIVIVAGGGSGVFEFSVDNGNNWQTLNSFQFLSSGFYQILVRNADGTCTVSGGTVNLTAAPDEPGIGQIATFNPTDCGATDGTITVVLTNDSGTFEYSADGGATWQASNIFDTLAAGSYEIRVRKSDQTCEVTGGTVVLNAPALPVIDNVAGISPSTCLTEDGSIIIEASGGNGFLEYSIDGGTTWSVSNTFGGLAAGTYNIAVRDAGTNCITTGLPVFLIQPGDDPVIDFVQPFNPSDCVSADGSIMISATACPGMTLEYSIDGGMTWALSSTFSGLSGGNYPLAVRNEGSASVVLGDTVILSAPLAPVINDLQITAPACSGGGGEILVIATGNNGDLDYSINGGTDWQADSLFTGLSAGTYDIIVRFPNSPCVSSVLTFALNPSDGPSLNGFTVFPDCGGGSGSITLFATGAGDLEFSIDGGATWQADSLFAGLSAGTYTPAVRELTSGCMALGAPIEVLAGGGPVISGVAFNDPSDCGLSDGNITITATGTGALEYSIDGGTTWSSSNVFADLPAGSYAIFVRNEDGSCPVEYAINPVILDDLANAPSILNISSSIPSQCGANDGFIVISATGNGTIEYSINGGLTYQSSPTFTGLGPGTYEIAVRFTGSNCVNTNTATLGGQVVCVDTVLVSIPFETTTVYCLDASVFQVGTGITSASFCGLGNPNT
ncbi:MAG: hypothetical protein D6714_15380, partial [Bacteroidetes bacterium]